MKMAILIGMCLMLLTVSSAEAYTLNNSSIPVRETTVKQNGDGSTTVIHSRPIMYAGSRMVKRPPYYKECKRKLGYWDEYLCAQYYVPKMLEKLDEED